MSRETLKEIRKTRLSLEELSERVGISTSQLSRFESGEREPRLSEAVRLAEVLCVEPGELFPELKSRSAQSDLEPGDKTANSLSLKPFLDAVEGSYHMLGLGQEEAAALLKLVVQVAQEPPTPSAQEDFHRVQAEREARKFLRTKPIRDGNA